LRLLERSATENSARWAALSLSLISTRSVTIHRVVEIAPSPAGLIVVVVSVTPPGKNARRKERLATSDGCAVQVSGAHVTVDRPEANRARLDAFIDEVVVATQG